MKQSGKLVLLKVLCLEDSPADAELIRVKLEESGYKLDFRLVSGKANFESTVRNETFDLILSDYRLPAYSGADALQFARENCPDVPFICISGTLGEELAVELMKMGSWDYVLKDKLFKLVPAVKRALKDSKERKALDEAGTELKKLSRAVEQSPAGVVITDTQGNIEYINQKFTEITGFEFGRVAGKTVRVLRKDIQSNTDILLIWKTISSGAEWKGEFYSKRSSGEMYWEYIIISSILNSDSEISNYIVIVEDITERKQMQIDLEQAKIKAEESDKLKTAFLHNMSHEIRTPMNGILGFAELLEMPLVRQEQRAEYLSYIKDSGKRLLYLLDEVFEISLIESGQEHVLLAPSDINHLILGELQKFRKEADNKDLILEFLPDLKGGKSIINTDADKVRRIINNLLENALKFTKAGFVQIGYVSQDGYLDFFVRDTGIGIPPELSEIVFEPFRQGDMSANRSFQGAGLGLAIAKAFVVLLGGNIWIDSEPGKGTSVFFRLPYLTPERN
jgi:PAS domain S-box-containing protein